MFLEGQTDISYLDHFDFFEKAGQQVVQLSADQFQQFKTYFDVILFRSIVLNTKEGIEAVMVHGGHH